jgi:hypothetical protein
MCPPSRATLTSVQLKNVSWSTFTGIIYPAKTNNMYQAFNIIPNVFTLSDRDTPAALLRKQISVNMTSTATLLLTYKSLNAWDFIGISAY